MAIVPREREVTHRDPFTLSRAAGLVKRSGQFEGQHQCFAWRDDIRGGVAQCRLAASAFTQRRSASVQRVSGVQRAAAASALGRASPQRSPAGGVSFFQPAPPLFLKREVTPTPAAPP